jgi:hypothetical protein
MVVEYHGITGGRAESHPPEVIKSSHKKLYFTNVFSLMQRQNPH